MQMLPVVAMWGHLWGLDMTATTAMPDAVLTGLARSLQHSEEFIECCVERGPQVEQSVPAVQSVLGTEGEDTYCGMSTLRYSSGTALRISTSFGALARLYFLEA